MDINGLCYIIGRGITTVLKKTVVDHTILIIYVTCIYYSKATPEVFFHQKSKTAQLKAL